VDKSPDNLIPGGAFGDRHVYFKAVAPGKSVIILRYGPIGKQKKEHYEELKYTVIVTK
jgi:hypothetical protein